MALYENETASNILTRMLARVNARYDKRTGSIIFNSTAPTAEELALLYEALDYIIEQALPDTAVREFLIRHCAARGIAPYAATEAVVIGKFTPSTMTLATGTRFNCGEFFYQITEQITNPGEVIDNPDSSVCYYYLECETAGAAANGTTGRLIPVENIAGLTSAEIIEVSVPGSDEEDTEHLRQRYYDSFGAEAFGGNIADYKAKVLALNGVGAVKVYPSWNGGGTVRLVIAADDSGNIVVPSQTLVENVQTAADPDVIDPEDQWGLGYGFAPIGHHVTVMGANAVNINVQTTLTLASGYTMLDAQSAINAALDAYYTGLNKNWSHVDNIIVRIAEINSRLLALPEIVDISRTMLNGEEINVIVDADSLAIRGSFTNV